MATIITKNSSTAGAVPIAGDLVQGEIAVNVTDKKLYTKNASGTVVQITPTVNDNGFKNRIINGAMMIDQRNAGASVTPVDNTYGLDRFKYSLSQASKLTAQQSTTAPTGYGFSYLHTVGASANVTVGPSDIFAYNQPIEGFNTADLSFGTASASTITLSFWVRSSLTGTFSVAFLNSASNRSYVATYTVNSANTFEQKTITISGDTSGTWVGATNGIGLRVYFDLGAGSTYTTSAGSWQTGAFTHATGATNLIATNGATFYITGVQLEKGSTATSFDYRPYGTELALCQRYALVFGGETVYEEVCNAYVFSSTNIRGTLNFPTTMRTGPAATFSGSWRGVTGGSGYVASAQALTDASTKYAQLSLTVSGATAGQAGWISTNNDLTARLVLSAEL